MRPVDRGETFKKDGVDKVYASYSEARGDLIERMGQYCSYCNQRLPASLAVEHVQPKSLVPGLEREWSNFLLACTNCNSVKGNTSIDLHQYLWPDVHNTHMAYEYTEDGRVCVHSDLEESLKNKAQNLLDLVGLQRYRDNPTASDRRWKNRKEAFAQAKVTLNLYLMARQNGSGEEFVKLIGIVVQNSGFFSIWMKVFETFSDVRKEIVHSMKGTSRDAFDVLGNSKKRTEIL